MEDTRGSLSALMEYEKRSYSCADYMEAAVEVPTCTPLHVILECANIVTDGRMTPASDDESALLRSPTRISQFPSTNSLQELLYTSSSNPSSPLSFKNASPQVFQQGSKTNTDMALWRSEMFQWASNVTDLFEIDREVIPMAFSILDRYVAHEADSDYPIQREDFQLFAMVAVYMSTKMSMSFRKIPIDMLLEMSRGFYQAEDIIHMEREILAALDWHVNPPTIMSFCRLLLELLPICDVSIEEMESTCIYFSDRATCDPYFVSKPDSSIALGIMLIAARRHGLSFDETQAFVDNLGGLFQLHDGEFESIFRKLEGLC